MPFELFVKISVKGKGTLKYRQSKQMSRTEVLGGKILNHFNKVGHVLA